MTKPRTAAGYRREHVNAVYATCLYVATVLGNLMDDLLIVAGGFVPFLIVPQDNLPVGTDPHVGTEDLDLGLSLALLDAEETMRWPRGFEQRASSLTGTRAAIALGSGG
jgi:hypothetical protein